LDRLWLEPAALQKREILGNRPADSNGHPKSEPATWSSEESRRHYDAEKLRSMMKLTRPAEFDAEAQERLCELIARAKSKQVKPGD